MVMHARKQPRFDDGHVDKRDSHLCQSTQYPSKAYGDHYSKQDGGRSRDDSPAGRDSSRYINKKSYIEKDKNRLERAALYNSPDKKVLQATSSSGYRGGSQNGSYSKGDPKSGMRDGKDQKAEVQKSAMRTCGNWSEHISSSGKQYYYNCKTEVSQWEKPKEWNDGMAIKHDRTKDIRGLEKAVEMSRNRGTSNDRASLSSSMDKSRRQGGLEFNPSLHSEKPDKQYLIKKFQDSQRQAQMESRPNLKYNQSMPPSRVHHGTSYSTDHSKSDSHHYRKDPGNLVDHVGVSNSTSRNRYHRDSNEGNRSHHGQRTPRKNDSQLDDMDISPDSTPTSSRPSSCTGTPQLGPTSTPASITTPGSATIATMAATSASSAPLISSLPQLITQLSGGQNNQELTQKALQTLQKLQEVITRQIAQQTHPSSGSSNSQHSSQIANDLISQSIQQPPVTKSSYSGHPQQLHQQQQHHQQQQQYRFQMNSHPQVSLSSPHQNLSSNDILSHHGKGAHMPPVGAPNSVYGKFSQASQQQQTFKPLHVETSSNNTIVLAGGGVGVSGTGNGNSPRSEPTSNSSCASPTSTTSSQGLPVPVEEGEGINKTESPSVSSSLSQYYNDKLIGHVTGWQADHAERQALRYWEEGISVGSFHCGQVSVELKRARSLVRLAEIQSTLHEQRILFLSQQVHELESMKAPSFSSSQSFNSTPQ